MILNTGSRTDIPAYYSEWFMNRIQSRFVMARNPYYPKQVYRYQLDPESVDILAFCTKNPQPMLEYMSELKDFRQLWYVTLTPYGKDIEPNVPDKHEVIRSIQKLSEAVGSFPEVSEVSWPDQKELTQYFPKLLRQIACRYICAWKIQQS